MEKLSVKKAVAEVVSAGARIVLAGLCLGGPVVGLSATGITADFIATGARMM